METLTTSYEQLSVTVTDCNNTNKNTVVGIYRPPSKSTSVFMNELTSHLSEMKTHKGALLVCGDFNIHIEKTNSNIVSRLQDTIDPA